MGKKRRRTSNQRDDTWTKGPEKPADAARRLKCARRFEDYYRQQLGLDDEEWRRMMATFRKPLPATFRVTAPDGLARSLLPLVESLVESLSQNVHGVMVPRRGRQRCFGRSRL